MALVVPSLKREEKDHDGLKSVVEQNGNTTGSSKGISREEYHRRFQNEEGHRFSSTVGDAEDDRLTTTIGASEHSNYARSLNRGRYNIEHDGSSSSYTASAGSEYHYHLDSDSDDPLYEKYAQHEKDKGGVQKIGKISGTQDNDMDMSNYCFQPERSFSEPQVKKRRSDVVSPLNSEESQEENQEDSQDNVMYTEADKPENHEEEDDEEEEEEEEDVIFVKHIMLPPKMDLDLLEARLNEHRYDKVLESSSRDILRQQRRDKEKINHILSGRAHRANIG